MAAEEISKPSWGSLLAAPSYSEPGDAQLMACHAFLCFLGEELGFKATSLASGWVRERPGCNKPEGRLLTLLPVATQQHLKQSESSLG